MARVIGLAAGLTGHSEAHRELHLGLTLCRHLPAWKASRRERFEAAEATNKVGGE